MQADGDLPGARVLPVTSIKQRSPHASSLYTYIYRYVHISVSIYIYMYTYVYLYLYIYIYINIYMFMYIFKQMVICQVLGSCL